MESKMRMSYKIILSCILFSIQSELHSASFFDERDEDCLTKKFETFEKQHDIEFSQLQEMGVFSSTHPNKFGSEEKALAESLIASLASKSGSITDSDSEKMSILKKGYRSFYSDYYPRAKDGQLSQKTVQFLIMFSTLYRIIQST